MIFELTNQNKLEEIKTLFTDIRFYMGNSVLDGVMGKAFVDNVESPNIAFLTVRKYCFVSGNIDDKTLKNIIDENFLAYTIIPNDAIALKIERLYSHNIQKSQRYSIKKGYSNFTVGYFKISHFVKSLVIVGLKLRNLFQEICCKAIFVLKHNQSLHSLSLHTKNHIVVKYIEVSLLQMFHTKPLLVEPQKNILCLLSRYT